MSPIPRPVEEASRGVYRGVWSVLVNLFKVPEHPPTLPAGPDEKVESFRPDPQFLRYLKLPLWLVIIPVNIVLVVAWVVTTVLAPVAGAVLLLPLFGLAVLPTMLAYLAIHLRYDTTWYVMTSRSMRLRRGIWVIHETTITFENVQNVTVNQGPIQRLFGIADVEVDTAGGGGKSDPTKGGLGAGHRGVIEGVADAARIRDLILARLRRSRSAGLGDELHHAHPGPGWTAEHVAVLREVRDCVQQLIGSSEMS